MWVRSLGGQVPLEEEMAPHSSILAWKIPGTEEPGGLQPMRSQRVRHDLATKQVSASLSLSGLHHHATVPFSLTARQTHSSDS